MGEVWRAEETRLGREVAIKLLPEVFVEDGERLERFEREATILAGDVDRLLLLRSTAGQDRPSRIDIVRNWLPEVERQLAGRGDD